MTQGEHRRSTRLARAPERVLLADRVRAAATGARGLGRGAFETALASSGVAFRANVASTGRVAGYSFALPGHVDRDGEPVWWKASQLDKALSWRQLAPVIQTPEPAPAVDVARGRFESAAKHAERTQIAAQQAAWERANTRMSAVPVDVAGRDAASRAWWTNRHGQDQARTAAGTARAAAERVELERAAKIAAQIAKVTRDPQRAAQLAQISRTNPEAFAAVMATQAMRAPAAPTAGCLDRARRQQRGTDPERGRGM